MVSPYCSDVFAHIQYIQYYDELGHKTTSFELQRFLPILKR
jgi:hypothetical protein